MSRNQLTVPVFTSEGNLRRIPALSRPKTNIQRNVYNAPPAPTPVQRHEGSRQLFTGIIPRTPNYGFVSSTPPFCQLDSELAGCQVPTQPPVADMFPHDGTNGDAILSTCVGGIIMFMMTLCLCYCFYKTRQKAILRQQQQQVQPTLPLSEPIEIIPAAERRRQMEGKLRHIQPDDIAVGEERYSCSICLNDFDTADKLSGSINRECQHYFHTECILEAFLQRPKPHYECPVCRRDFFNE